MRTAVLALAVLLLVSVSAASASIVLHGVEGVVACDIDAWDSSGYALDHLGQVWGVNCGGFWERPVPSFRQVPVPVDSLRFWGRYSVVTVSDDVYFWTNAAGWILAGSLPTTSGIQEDAKTPATAARVVPNSTPGTCKVSFVVSQAGMVSAAVFDVGGRQVRELLNGTYPAGDYSPIWDGRDDGGREVPAGAYFAQVSTTTTETSTKLVITR
jgi:hypothetical protein